VNFVVHFHGHNNHVAQVFQQFDLEHQMAASKLNAVLLVPQGPKDVADSGDGKLEYDTDGLTNLLSESLAFLKKEGKVGPTATLGKVALTAHSGGYKVVSAILARKEKLDITDVILFDATYGGLGAFADWVASDKKHRLMSICTDHLGHKNAQLMALLQKRKQSFQVRMEGDLTIQNVARRGATFVLTTTLEHNDVVAKRNYFADWLAPSFR